MSSTQYGGFGSTQYDPVSSAAGRKTHVQAPASPRNVFVVTGCVLLVLLSVVPLWNAIALMSDYNYTFWFGYATPLWMIFCCITVISLYMLTILVFFSRSRPQTQTEQTIMMIANVFITLLGMVLMLASLPLSRQAIESYNNLMHRCDFSQQTHRLYEYSQVLQNVRAAPACANKFSVEECKGYEDAQPYTDFLKVMENNYRCSGFCYRVPQFLQEGAMNASSPPTEGNPVVANVTFLSQPTVASRIQRHADHAEPLSLVSAGYDMETQSGDPAGVYPPTLFSDANYQASCEGMVARDMKNFTGDIGFQTFYQGVYLVLISIATGFLKLIGFCVRKDHDYQQ